MKAKFGFTLGLVSIVWPMLGQTPDSASAKQGKVSIHIIKEMDGRETVFDTTFNTDGSADFQQLISKIKPEEMQGESGAERRIIINMDEIASKSGNREPEIEIRKRRGSTIHILKEREIPEPVKDGDNYRYDYKITDGYKEENETMHIDELIDQIDCGDGKVRHIEIYDHPGKGKKRPKKIKRKVIIIEEK